VVSNDIKIRVDLQDGFSGHEGFGFSFVFFFEEELSVEV